MLELVYVLRYSLFMTLDGNRVRRFLNEGEHTKEWLAVQLKCSLKTVDNILAGRFPRGETLVALANLIGCQVEDLVTQQVAAKRPA
jgi:hypothetical protein